jgi:predicted transcriptional regulator
MRGTPSRVVREEDILRVLLDGPKTPSEIAESLNLGYNRRNLVFYHLSKLMARGLVRKDGGRYSLANSSKVHSVGFERFKISVQ